MGNEFQTNLVPFPRLHFMITSMAPVVTKKKMETTNTNIQSITEGCFSAQNFFTKIADFDAEEDKYMAISVNYRGTAKAKEANATVQRSVQQGPFPDVDCQDQCAFGNHMKPCPHDHEHQCPASWTDGGYHCQDHGGCRHVNQGAFPKADCKEQCF